MEKIKIKYHTDITKIEKISVGDWIDLRLAEDYELKAGEFKLLSLGVSMKLPDGYEAIVNPRGSTFLKCGVLQANSQGVIDNSYSGTTDVWRFPAFPTKDVYLEKDTRICQFRIQKVQPQIEFEEVDSLDDTDRGGFGSTGEK